MPKKAEDKKVVSDGSGDQPAADFKKYSEGAKRREVAQPSEDEPHGHPFQPTSAEPLLVVRYESDKGRKETGNQRDMVHISPSEAYDDPDFNPVAAADVPGHKGGPQAEGGTERPVGVTDDGSGDKENAEALDFNWKNEDSQPK